MTEHAQAQQHILAMNQLYSRFPTLLPGALHSIHMVTGGCPCAPSHFRMVSAQDTDTVLYGHLCYFSETAPSMAPVSVQESCTNQEENTGGPPQVSGRSCCTCMAHLSE